MATARFADPKGSLVLYFDDDGERHIVMPNDVRLNLIEVGPYENVFSTMIVPESVTRFQAQHVMRRTIRESGKSMLTEVNEFLLYAVEQTSALPESDPVRRAADLNYLAFTAASVFERKSDLIDGIGALLGLDDEQIDNLFIEAATVAR